MNDLIPDAAATPTPVDRAEAIFRRYPNISADEVHEAATFLKDGKHLDIGLLTGNPDIRGNIEAFRQDHSRALSPGWTEQGAFVLIFLILVGGLVYFLAR